MSVTTLNENLDIIQNLVIPFMEDDVDVIQKLDDEPNDVGGLSAAELKAKFDEAGNIIKGYINNTLVPQLSDTVAEAEERRKDEAQRQENEEARQEAEENRQNSFEEELAEAKRLNEASEESAGEAADSATESKSWARGGTGTRAGEDTDNAKYWYEQAKKYGNPVTSVNGQTGAVKVTQAVQRSGTFTVAGWVAGTGYAYEQTVSVEGLKAEYDTRPMVDISLPGTSESANKAVLKAFGQVAMFDTGNGILTAYAPYKPAVNMTVNVITQE